MADREVGWKARVESKLRDPSSVDNLDGQDLSLAEKEERINMKKENPTRAAGTWAVGNSQGLLGSCFGPCQKSTTQQRVVDLKSLSES